MDFDSKHFQLVLPTAGYGAAKQNSDTCRNQLLAFIANIRVPVFPCGRNTVRFAGVE